MYLNVKKQSKEAGGVSRFIDDIDLILKINQLLVLGPSQILSNKRFLQLMNDDWFSNLKAALLGKFPAFSETLKFLRTDGPYGYLKSYRVDQI